MSNINKRRVRQRVIESSVSEVTKSSSGGSSSSDYAANLKGRPILDFSKIVVPDIVRSVAKQTAKPQSRCYGNRKHKLMKERVNRFVASTPVYRNTEPLFTDEPLSPINIITDLFYHERERSTSNSPSSAVKILSFPSEENLLNIHPRNEEKPTKNKSTIENQALKTVDCLKGNQRETNTSTTYDSDRMSVLSEASVDTNPCVDMEMVLSDEEEHIISPKKNRKPTVKSSLKRPSKRNILKIEKNTLKSTKIKTKHSKDPTKEKSAHVDLRSHTKDVGLSEASPRSTAKENVDPSEIVHAIKSADKNTENVKSRKNHNKNQQMDELIKSCQQPIVEHVTKTKHTINKDLEVTQLTPTHFTDKEKHISISNESTVNHLYKKKLSCEDGNKSAETTPRQSSRSERYHKDSTKSNEPTSKHLSKNNLTVIEEGTKSAETTPRKSSRSERYHTDSTKPNEPTSKHLSKNNLTVIEEGTKSAEVTPRQSSRSERYNKDSTKSNEPTSKHPSKNNLTVIEEGTKSTETTQKRLNTSETLHRAKSREMVEKVHNRTKQTSKGRNKTSGSPVNSKRRNLVKRAVVVEENDAARDGVRRSKRPRVAPLKYWKGEKIVYCLDANYCLNMVDVYTLSDDETFVTKRKVQKNKDKVFQEDPVLKETKKTVSFGWPNETEIGSHFSKGALEHDTEGVWLQMGYTDTVSGVSSGVWRLDPSAQTRSCFVNELYMCMTVVCGKVEFAIDEEVYRGTTGSQYIIHRGSTFTLSNVGHSKALVTYTKHGAEELSGSGEMVAN
uniref:Mif2/CENP-C cupin domain-containing protein n=1 Tax=Timema tahoe TaxID=61484 RepID=A0A7R9IMT2_9NEOP|nr:unnamed protein product [Timema tahoe]